MGTDRRKPTVNANGKFYGSAEFSTDYVPILDPARNAASEVFHPVRDPKTPSHRDDPLAPSPYWGDKPIWDAQTSNHNPMMDEKGRPWFTARVRPRENPDFCKKGSNHPSAKAFPIDSSNRHLSMYDPASGKFTLISTCFPTHHLIFAEDANNTLWTSSGGSANGVVGWLDRPMFDNTGDEVRSQGWTPFIIDTNGNGKRDEYVEPNQPMDPAKDKRVQLGFYSVAVNPVDSTVWGTSLSSFPGYAARLAPGADPTHTALTEIYEPPLPGYGPRGGDIDRNGVFWSSLSSGHPAAFDRRKCKGPLNGPKAATGRHCPEGWTYPIPGPNFRDITETGSAESSYYSISISIVNKFSAITIWYNAIIMYLMKWNWYYTWIDQYDTFGLGKNVPIVTGNLSDALFALVNGKWITLRVPFPNGFYTKWVDGRIDNPNTGWKGKSMWATYSTRTMFHLEGGTENKPKVVRFQLRPDPLAK